MVVDRYKADPRGMPREEYNPDLDALVPVVRGELPMFIAASNENEIRRALALAKEFDVKVTVVGATEGFEAIDALKSARPPVVSVNFPDAAAGDGLGLRVRHATGLRDGQRGAGGSGPEGRRRKPRGPQRGRHQSSRSPRAGSRLTSSWPT